MKFDPPLIRGTLVKRYKRFMADVILDSGETVTAHCANSGSMLGCQPSGAEVWLSLATNPDRKLKYTWEMVRIGEGLVGINTALTNHLAEEAIRAGRIPELAGYSGVRREVRYGANSRIDLLLEEPGRAPCYVEVKNVTLSRAVGRMEFPDAVTERGRKHLGELSAMVAAGARAVMLFVAQRDDGAFFTVAGDIDPAYEKALTTARTSGVEALCYICSLTPEEIAVTGFLPLRLNHE